MAHTRKWLVAAVLATACVPGCVEQSMTIQSDPPNALVYLNDQELGRTPVTRDFKWYGDYDVQLRLDGYQTIKTHQSLVAPAWNWVPFDLISNLIPFTLRDHKSLAYTLKPVDPAKDEPIALLERAEALKGQVESSTYTRVPTPRTTRPSATTRPTTKTATTAP
jgi:hypothetical protein